MAVPKRRMSRANTHARRSQWKADNVALQHVKIQGQDVQIPRRREGRSARSHRVRLTGPRRRDRRDPSRAVV